MVFYYILPDLLRGCSCALQKSEKFIYLVFEYCAGGDLSRLIQKQGPFSEAQCKAMMMQLGAFLVRRCLPAKRLILWCCVLVAAKGIEFMWSNHLIHRDLKPQNILLSEESPDAVLKIGVCAGSVPVMSL